MGQDMSIKVVQNTDIAGDSSEKVYINKEEYDAITDGKLNIHLDIDSSKYAVGDSGAFLIGNSGQEFSINQQDLDNGYVDKGFTTAVPADGESVKIEVYMSPSVNGAENLHIVKTVVVDTTPPTITIDEPIEGDNKITASEDDDVTISGVTTAEDGQTVTVTITDKNGDEVTADVVAQGGKWSVDNIDITGLATGDLKVKAEVEDIAGNKADDTANSPVTYVTLDSSNDDITVSEDVPYALTANDFGDWQQQGSEPTGVVITELPTNGTLALDGVAISAGQSISMDDINAGKLTFTSNENSDEDGKFEFKLTDGSEVSQTPYTTTIDVNAVADAPTVTVEDVNPSREGVTAGEGLTTTTYNNVLYKDLHPDDYVQNGNVLEAFADHYAETYSGNTQVVSEFSSNSNLAAETMVAAKGYVYLEAGQQVTFSGTVDDTAMIKLGGEVVLYTKGDAYGQVNSESAGTATVGNGETVSQGAFTVTQSGYYELETYVLNSGGPGNYNIQMSVDGGTTYKDINTENFEIYATRADVAEYGKNAGQENTDIKLSDIDAALTDTDGSETLSVSVEDIPMGATLSDGTNTFTASSTGTTADVTGWDLNNLTLNSPVAGTYALNVVATSKEASNGDTASTSQILSVSVTNFPVDDEAVFIPEKFGGERDLQHDVNTGNANDYLVVGDDIGSSWNYETKHVEVNMNGGNDVIEIDGAIDWYARVNMGDGDDVIRSWAGSIKGDSIVDMGDGNDIITTDGGYYDRTEVYMGNGDDTLYARCNIDYDAKVYMGEGDDTVSLGGGMYANAQLSLGEGNDTVTMVASMNHQASIDAGNGNDVLNVTEGSIRHNTKVDMGNGDDTINVRWHIGNNTDIDLGEGNDSMVVQGGMFDKADVNMGNGDDTFSLGGYAYGESKVDMGDGEDTLYLPNAGRSVDLTDIATHFDNVETLDISGGKSSTFSVSASDVIDMTDGDNVLKINGDHGDTVEASEHWSWNSWSNVNDDNWTHTGSENGYEIYQSTYNGESVTLMVQDTVNVDL